MLLQESVKSKCVKASDVTAVSPPCSYSKDNTICTQPIMAPCLKCVFLKRHLIPCKAFKGKRLLQFPWLQVKQSHGSSWQWLSQVTGALTHH